MEKIKELLFYFTQPSPIGVQSYEIVPLETPLTIAHYKQFLAENMHGEMHYLQNHLPLKENPQNIHEGLRSAIVMTFPYFPHPESHDPYPHLRKALYAKGYDYHYWIKQKLKPVIETLSQQFPEATFISATDSAPVLERDLAAKAGLGWFGKNTCLISPEHGSLFFIAEIMTSLDVQLLREVFGKTPWLGSESVRVADFCGTCTRCIDICPTQAIEAPRKLNATKCISYLTIESKNPVPEDLKDKMGDWFFGCDLCQTVCPWNEKAFAIRKQNSHLKKDVFSTEKTLVLTEEEKLALKTEIEEILAFSGNQLLKKIKNTPMERAGHKGLKRNALRIKELIFQ